MLSRYLYDVVVNSDILEENLLMVTKSEVGVSRYRVDISMMSRVELVVSWDRVEENFSMSM